MRSRLLLFAAIASGGAFAQAQPIVAAFERFHAREAADAASSIEGGLLLLNELNCVACHEPPAGWRKSLPGRGKISLVGVDARLTAATLGEFIRAPHQFKPGTVMPEIASNHGGPEADRALVAYLFSPTPSSGKRRAFPPGNARRGENLFTSIGCAACHAAGDTPTTYPSVPLGLAASYERNALAAFLQDPLHVRPAGRMPSVEMTDAEAADLAEFLGAKERPTNSPAPSFSPEQVAAGRAEFVARNCAACHETKDGHAVATARPLAEVRTDRGCLAAQPPVAAPRFHLNPVQSHAITAAVRALQSQPSPPPQSAEQRVAARFEQLNCYACHAWRGRGGAEAARAKHFTATDSATESLGELGHLPPKLDTAGRKLTPAWLARLLWSRGGGVRPYMTARMPRFGETSTHDLVPLLAEACRPAKPQEIDTSGGKGHQRFATGRTLLGTGPGGIGCVACHGLKDREPTGVRAINLTHTAQRVQPEYFKALLLDPQRMQPGTIMPPLLAGRKDADKEVESIWTYFKELDQNPLLPEGLAVAGSFELKPAGENRPIVFRTFLEGAGTQAIAVGYRAGAHAAFDSFEVRWALVWRGRFLDAQSNWEERPMKPIKPLGDNVRPLPSHLPFAQLRTGSDPWPAEFGSRAGYAFKGYRLGADGVPTFRYSIAGLTIEDTLRPLADGTGFQRRVVVRGSGEGWYFRGLAVGSPLQPVQWKNGTAVFDESISF